MIIQQGGASQVALGVKNTPADAADVRNAGSIPAVRRSPREGNSNPLQYSCLGNSTKRSLVGYSPWDHKELDMAEAT